MDKLQIERLRQEMVIKFHVYNSVSRVHHVYETLPINGVYCRVSIYKGVAKNRDDLWLAYCQAREAYLKATLKDEYQTLKVIADH